MDITSRLIFAGTYGGNSSGTSGGVSGLTSGVISGGTSGGTSDGTSGVTSGGISSGISGCDNLLSKITPHLPNKLSHQLLVRRIVLLRRFLTF